ncbi:hypothetical protein [Teredinibacter purpureus]|uniref:hypothetical protein n=1 Tax=Teredinibacter purpureus TaxID=2731756 RepID=UPI0005F7691A|nr:hypothetical protein [Teredinibacter purpureus]
MEKTKLDCEKCGTEMNKTSRSEHNYGLQVLGVILFIVGVICLFIVPIGTIIGVILMILSARLGFKKSKVWLCNNCGYFFNRA